MGETIAQTNVGVTDKCGMAQTNAQTNVGVTDKCGCDRQMRNVTDKENAPKSCNDSGDFCRDFKDRVENIAENIEQRVEIIAEDRRCIKGVMKCIEKVECTHHLHQSGKFGA
jgi:hypothetical protein